VRKTCSILQEPAPRGGACANVVTFALFLVVVSSEKRNLRSVAVVGRQQRRGPRSRYARMNRHTIRCMLTAGKAESKKSMSILTYEEFVSFTRTKRCHYCHNPVHWQDYNATHYNLDRKNNGLGYSLLNCAVCCKRCNRGKS
jgi:hypothetical protein